MMLLLGVWLNILIIISLVKLKYGIIEQCVLYMSARVVAVDDGDELKDRK